MRVSGAATRRHGRFRRQHGHPPAPCEQQGHEGQTATGPAGRSTHIYIRRKPGLSPGFAFPADATSRSAATNNMVEKYLILPDDQTTTGIGAHAHALDR